MGGSTLPDPTAGERDGGKPMKVLVTGGTSGLGLAMASALTAAGAGGWAAAPAPPPAAGGPSRAGSEALSRIMAADLRDTGVTVNLLLPGGATSTGMLPADVPPGRDLLEPAVMGPPIVWLASAEAAGVHDERIIAAEFERWLRDWNRRPRGEG